MARCSRRKFGAHERGAEAVELALVVPIFLLLVFGVIDFGYVINRDTMVNNASREGAREGAVNPNQAAITAKVRQELSTVEAVGTSPSRITVIVTCRKPEPDHTICAPFDTYAKSGGTVIVKVDYRHSWITPVGSTFGDITLSKTTEMRIE